ncbi:Pseudaminic acid synthase protein [Marine Group I thaumarchaeote SCGC AAA799-P11]|uniref:Pseudaminic acid synthase protein n=1 Tax=Marine Group I thaumarchaeote SCGC AAA799-P11 TaxID=1502295 RepID=A0A087S2Z3_9ARCH|nr:Pseudaminic acid synthase protein [Marine Group I thaumarchaeote SCGC AAA799-P11]
MKNNQELPFDNWEHTFVIAEAGSNWRVGEYQKDIAQAKQLIDIAKKAGADAVKFQTYKSKTVYVENAGKSDYLAESGIQESINDIFENLSMPYEMIPIISKYCEKKNILFMSTPFSIEDAKAIDPFVKIHKIASFEINHIPLLEFLAKTQKPIIISTGASNETEIKFAIDIIKKNGNLKIGLMQCTSKYPAPLSTLNLSAIPNMKKTFEVPVGFSDHSLDPIIAPLCAVGFGATVVEKHFTNDKKLPGPDHSFALEPKELEQMIKSIRSADKTKGLGKKEVLDEEKELREFATRSLQAIKNIKKGEIFRFEENFSVLRSGKRKRGLDARYLYEVDGKTSIRNIEKGDGITEYK